MTRSLVLAAVLVAAAGCGKSAPSTAYTVSEEKAEVSLKVAAKGKPYVPANGERATVALIGSGGIRYDLKYQSPGVFASDAAAPVPHGSYSAALFVDRPNKRGGQQSVNLTREPLTVAAGRNELSVNMPK
jgi:hypothetical protein